MNFDAAYASLNAILVAGTITVVVAMGSAAIIHGVAKAVAALGLTELDAEPAAGTDAAGGQTAIAIAIAAAKRYQDTV